MGRLKEVPSSEKVASGKQFRDKVPFSLRVVFIFIGSFAPCFIGELSEPSFFACSYFENICSSWVNNLQSVFACCWAIEHWIASPSQVIWDVPSLLQCALNSVALHIIESGWVSQKSLHAAPAVQPATPPVPPPPTPSPPIPAPVPPLLPSVLIGV